MGISLFREIKEINEMLLRIKSTYVQSFIEKILFGILTRNNFNSCSSLVESLNFMFLGKSIENLLKSCLTHRVFSNQEILFLY